MTSATTLPAGAPCPNCGFTVAPLLLSCPSCQRLVHTDRLNDLAAAAQDAERRQDPTTAIRHWREALELLPPNTRQFQTVAARLDALSRSIDQASAAPATPPNWLKRLGPVAPVLFLLWKFKAILLLLLTKGKLLLLGLTKLSTLSTMLLSLGAYWALYGWRFALGLVLSIYVHETGHVYALRRFGIKASAPMFIPLLGAVVRLHQHAFTRLEDARIGLAGPAWGLAGAVATFVAYWLTGSPVLGVIGHVAAWINLLNLLPVWQLDGSRGFAALSRQQRGLLVLFMALMWIVTREGFLLILAAVAVWRLFTRDWPEDGDWKTWIQFAGLLVGLSLLLSIPTPVPQR